MEKAFITYYIKLKVESGNFINYTLFFGIAVINLHLTATTGKGGKKRRKSHFIKINRGPKRF